MEPGPGHEQACAAAERTGLSAGQRDAVVIMLTAATATTALVAAAGAGKSHTMAGFARLWTTFTGRRVIGLMWLPLRLLSGRAAREGHCGGRCQPVPLAPTSCIRRR